MTKPIRFTKMHHAGNDYIYVYTPDYLITNPKQAALAWSAPHTGIGSDGLVLIGRSEVADFSMRIFNSDGSEAMMCGNASCCIGKYVYEKGLTNKQRVRLETLSGIKILQLTIRRDKVAMVTVGMGIPVIHEPALELTAGGKRFTGAVISMGNPHFVIFADDLNNIDLSVIGPLLENHPLFPNRTNVEFVQLLSPGEIRVRVWERGSGITQACGTGACATVAAAVAKGLTKRTVKVNMDGGAITVDWDEKTGNISMTGRAVTVFEGEIGVDIRTTT